MAVFAVNDLLPIQTGVAECSDKITAVARITCEALSLRNSQHMQRILIIEPHTADLAKALQDNGFSGERIALFRRPPLISSIQHEHEHVIMYDWLDALDHQETEGASLQIEELGQIDAIVVHEVLRMIPRRRLTALLSWLGSLINEHAYIICSEPVDTRDLKQFERTAKAQTIVLAADICEFETPWPHSIALFQRRQQNEVQRTRGVQQVTFAELQENEAQRLALIETYRAVFGGEEWREWAYCPACGRQYSRKEMEAECPQGLCACGWLLPLKPFHTAESVVAKLRDELYYPELSCCYLHPNETHADGIDGFAWGYLTSAPLVVETLIPNALTLAKRYLLNSLRELQQDAEGAAGWLYYHSELGITEGIRSLNLTRALFQRSLQFAFQRGAQTIILRTSRQSPVFRLLTGLGMSILFEYARCYDVQDADRQDQRVILGGNIRDLLQIFLGDSDRRLAVRIAHGLRQQN